MIIHCTKCHHEWQIAQLDQPTTECWYCGSTEGHVDGCAIMTCDWCDAPGKVIGGKSDNLPPMEEVMKVLATMNEHRCEELKPLGECYRCDLNRDEQEEG